MFYSALLKYTTYCTLSDIIASAPTVTGSVFYACRDSDYFLGQCRLTSYCITENCPVKSHVNLDIRKISGEQKCSSYLEDMLISRIILIIKILGRTNCKFENFGEVLQMTIILLFGQLF